MHFKNLDFSNMKNKKPLKETKLLSNKHSDDFHVPLLSLEQNDKINKIICPLLIVLVDCIFIECTNFLKDQIKHVLHLSIE